MANDKFLLGVISDQGEIRAQAYPLSMKDLAVHQSMEKGRWRWWPKTQTVYWWDYALQPKENIEAVENWLTNRGYPVSGHTKHLSFYSVVEMMNFPLFRNKLIIFLSNGQKIVLLKQPRGRYQSVGDYRFWAESDREMKSIVNDVATKAGGIERFWPDPSDHNQVKNSLDNAYNRFYRSERSR